MCKPFCGQKQRCAQRGCDQSDVLTGLRSLTIESVFDLAHQPHEPAFWIRKTKLCRDRYIQSATNRAVALRWLCSVGYVRCVPIVSYTSVALRSLRCVRCIQIVTYSSLALRWMRCVRCVALLPCLWFETLRTERLRCVGCIRSVHIVPI